LFLPSERRALMPLPLSSDPSTGLGADVLDEARRESEELIGANRISYFEMNLYMRHMLLRDSDAFSMAAPIEYRVPFLDHRMVEAVFSMPDKWKVADPRPKPLLLDVAGDRVSPTVWQRAKQGFTFPWNRWLEPSGALGAIARDAANDVARWRSLGLNPVAVADTWNRFGKGDRRVSALQILAFVVMRDFSARHNLNAA
jgi:asparagine synthetase B (glutamine-hydrolysing)